MTKDAALKLALEAYIKAGVGNSTDFVLQGNAYDLAIGALEHPQEARNFCFRCGKRTPDLAAIHTCTPPRGLEMT